MPKLRLEKDRAFYKTFVMLMIPLLLQSGLESSVQFVNNLMLGTLGEIPMSVSSLGNQPFMLFSTTIRGLSVGGGVLIAQYWGKRDLKAIHRVISIGIKTALVVAVIVSALVSAFPAQVMSIFSKDTEVIRLGINYLRVVAITYIFYAISLNFLTYLRSVGNTRTPLIINTITYGTNILLNFLLIFGYGGLPQMGLMGVALGTLISRIVEVICYITYMFVIDKQIGLKFRHMLGFDRVLFKDFINYGLPSLGTSLLSFSLGNTGTAIIFGRMGTTATAANTVVSAMIQMFSILMSGLCYTASVVIGNSIGRGLDNKTVKRQAVTLEVICLFFAAFSLVVSLALIKPIIGMFNIEAETAAICQTMAIIGCITMFFNFFEILYDVGILVGSGDTKFIFLYTTGTTWILIMPFAFLASFVWKWSIPAVYFVLRMEYVLKALWGWMRLRGTKYKWIKRVTRDTTPDQEAGGATA